MHPSYHTHAPLQTYKSTQAHYMHTHTHLHIRAFNCRVYYMQLWTPILIAICPTMDIYVL